MDLIDFGDHQTLKELCSRMSIQSLTVFFNQNPMIKQGSVCQRPIPAVSCTLLDRLYEIYIHNNMHNCTYITTDI